MLGVLGLGRIAWCFEDSCMYDFYPMRKGIPYSLIVKNYFSQVSIDNSIHPLYQLESKGVVLFFMISRILHMLGKDVDSRFLCWSQGISAKLFSCYTGSDTQPIKLCTESRTYLFLSSVSGDCQAKSIALQFVEIPK